MILTAFVYLVGSIVVIGNRIAGYHHACHTISELAESGSEHSQKVSFGVFLPIAICLGIVAWLVRFTDPPIAALALSIALGYGFAAMFPCDRGSPAFGSVRQAFHNLGGGIEYIGGALSLVWIGESGWPGFQSAGLLVGLSAIILSFESGIRGIIQRMAESCLFLCLLAALWVR